LDEQKKLCEWKTHNKTNGKHKGTPVVDKKATKKMKGVIAAFFTANTEAMKPFRLW
jgi:hypothetical protein